MGQFPKPQLLMESFEFGDPVTDQEHLVFFLEERIKWELNLPIPSEKPEIRHRI